MPYNILFCQFSFFSQPPNLMIAIYEPLQIYQTLFPANLRYLHIKRLLNSFHYMVQYFSWYRFVCNSTLLCVL